VESVHHRYSVLLGLILLSLTFQLAAGDSDAAFLTTVILLGATLVVAVITSRAHPYVIRLAVAATVLLVAAAVGAVVGTEELGNDSARVVSLLLVALAPPAIANGILWLFREERQITRQTMFGVLCIYLLIGMLFGTAFATIDELGTNSFFEGGEDASSDFLYFSFSTLTTIGYGDLVAATNLGRSLAITEALVGQIYLVAVVGLIVSNLRPTATRDADL
jgi:hypothetical protein